MIRATKTKLSASDFPLLLMLLSSYQKTRWNVFHNIQVRAARGK